MEEKICLFSLQFFSVFVLILLVNTKLFPFFLLFKQIFVLVCSIIWTKKYRRKNRKKKRKKRKNSLFIFCFLVFFLVFSFFSSPLLWTFKKNNKISRSIDTCVRWDKLNQNWFQQIPKKYQTGNRFFEYWLLTVTDVVNRNFLIHLWSLGIELQCLDVVQCDVCSVHPESVDFYPGLQFSFSLHSCLSTAHNTVT